jgi:hypothetical protein
MFSTLLEVKSNVYGTSFNICGNLQDLIGQMVIKRQNNLERLSMANFAAQYFA